MNNERRQMRGLGQNQSDTNGSRSSSHTDGLSSVSKPLRVAGSLLTVLAVATCLAVGSDCMFRTFQDDSGLQRNLTLVQTGFNATTLLTYVVTAHTIFYYPAYVLYMMAHSKHFKVWQTTRECFQLFKSDASALHRQVPLSSSVNQHSFMHAKANSNVKLLVSSLLLIVLWNVCIHFLIRSLEYLDSALSACIVFATHCGLEYFQCWIILHRKFMVLRVIAFLLASFCLITQTYIDFCKSLCFGVLMVASASVGISLYKVFMRKYISIHQNKGQVAFYFSLKGLVSSILLLPVMLSLLLTENEVFDVTNVHLGYLIIGIICLLGYVLLVYLENVKNCTECYTVGCILSIPLSLLMPSLRGALQPFVPLKTLGLITAVLSALITLIPEHWITAAEKLLNTKNTNNNQTGKDRFTQTPSKAAVVQARH